MKKLIYEGIAIVISILLAFAIDAMWTRYQQRQKAESILIDLKTEFEENKERLDFIVNVRTNRSDNATLLMQDPFSIDTSRLNIVLMTVFLGHTTVNLSSGAYSILISASAMDQIRSMELRKQLAEWPALIDENLEDEIIEMELVRNQLTPYLSTKLSIAPLFYSHQRVYDSFPVTDFNWIDTDKSFMSELKFQNLVAVRLANSTILIREAKKLQDAAVRIIDLIDQELKE